MSEIRAQLIYIKLTIFIQLDFYHTLFHCFSVHVGVVVPQLSLAVSSRFCFSFFLSVFLRSCLSVLVCLCLCLRAGLFTESRLRPNTPVLSDDLAKKSLLKVLAEDQSSLSYSVS